MAESGGETSITVNAPISMHMLAFLLQRTIVPEKWCDTIPYVYAPMRRSSGRGRPEAASGVAQALGVGEAEAEQGHELAALAGRTGLHRFGAGQFLSPAAQARCLEPGRLGAAVHGHPL